MEACETPVRDDFFDSLVGDFLDESAQLLERLGARLLELDQWVESLAAGESARCDDDMMNDMFRSAHSLKGLSAMLGLSDINHLTHKIENVFDAARRDELAFTPESVQLIFRSVDQLSGMIECLKNVDAPRVDASEVEHEIQQLLAGCGAERKLSSQADAERALESTAPAASVSATPAIEHVDHFEGIADEAGTPAKYLSIFVDETLLSLDTLTEALLSVEGSDNRQSIESLLITSHRIKGSAACIGLNRPAKLAHLMEDLVQRLRDEGGDLTPAMADGLLKCSDALRTYTEGLRSGAPDSSGFNQLAHCLLAVERGEATSPPSSALEVTATDQLASSIAAPSDLGALAVSIASLLDGRRSGICGRVTFVPELPLAGLKARLVYEKLANVGEVVHCQPPAESLEELDSLDALTFGVLTDASADVVQSRLRIAGVASVSTAPLGQEASATSARKETSQPATTSTSASTAAPKPIAAPPKAETKSSGDAEPNAKGGDAAKPTETLRVDIERLDQLMNLAGQLVINKARFNQIDDSLKHVTFGKQTSEAIDNALQLIERIGSADDLDDVRAHARRMQADLQGVRKVVNQWGTVRGAILNLHEAVHQLDRVSDAIQKSVMDTRMLPIGPLFGRFRRVIRDITRLNGKDIRLVIRGEKTELDKRMIDELGDPLIHMVRNSADHGIETPDVREAAGKPREGTVTLDAFHRGNSIIIRVTDDGRGLDQDRIRAKAIEKGIVSPADAEKLTPHQIYQLIWEPGFSTAEKVTEISGRGMGMDIVKSKIEDINGTVEIDSEPGRGTTLTIKLPLTLAILPSLMAEIEGDVFALPIESVVEIVSVPPDAMTSVHGLPNAVVRGRVVSVAHLPDIFTWVVPPKTQSVRAGDDTTLVIIGDQGHELGLVVDRLLGEEDIVIKSMAENYRNVYGIAGASILGDGRVSLILDTGVLIEMAAKAAASGTRNESLASIRAQTSVAIAS